MKDFKFYLYKPLIFFVILFIIDKIFLISYFQKEFLQTGNIVYYRHRPILLEKLKNDKDPKKLIIAFGDSRAYSYSQLAFKGERKEKYKVFNFSAPQGVTAYSYYIFEKILKENIKPELAILIISPEGFDDSKAIFNSPFLRMGADDEFVKKHWDYFPQNAKEEYILDKIVTFRRLEFNYKLFFERIQKGKLSEYNIKTNSEMPLLDISNGAQLAYMSLVNDVKQLEKDTLRIKNIYLGKNFKVNVTSFYFVEKFLELAKEKNIKVFTVWPRVYSSYRNEYSKLELEKKFGERLENLTNSYNQKYYNLNKILECDDFYDASHQSVSCFGKNLNFFIDELEKIKE